MTRVSGLAGEFDLADEHPPDLPAPGALVVTIDRLTKTYGRRHAVHDLSIGVLQGEVYGLLGPNGAGKTTTLRMLLGLVRPTSGSARVCDARPGSPAGLARVGALVEEPAFYPYLSGRDNLRVLARYSRSPRARIGEVIELVGLAPHARDKVSTYSLGMRQRLGVAAALLKNPDVLILDEPTSGLDPQGMAQMCRLISTLGTGGRTVVLSSHMPREVEQICDRVGVIRDGELIAQGAVSELRGAQVLHIVADEVERAHDVLERIRYVDAVTAVGDTLVVDAPADAAAHLNTALIEHGIAVSHLSLEQRSLEDVFFDMTEEAAEDPEGEGERQRAGGRGSDG